MNILNDSQLPELHDKLSLCQTHYGMKMEMLCVECNDVICTMCVAASHREHVCVGIGDIVDDFQYQVSADIR